MYNPIFEQDFLRHIPTKLKPIYLKFLVLNLGLLLDNFGNMEREQIERFLCFLLSRESIEVIEKQGAKILYNDPTITP